MQMQTIEPVDLTQQLHALRLAARSLLIDIEQRVAAQHDAAVEAFDRNEIERLAEADALTWLDEAERALRRGLMFAERAILQPATF
ncbi:hypothetical protein [Dyella caseinilytica]|uniref:Uncharacterized protein n=1 Tax=Dyella caseinilytica TaxID=1849581 RepID=A0ABX7GZ51_9GAMM|nr:hypothetical protein [Dyella caseinilytica]QRN55303.1 hypothetical protein ISN74_08250 [Dyella caseinilytica]GGA00843.1 hypothetical protein GCM10011408_22290 [Dyella caseinilytica]